MREEKNAASAFIDSTPELHIGDSAFESWYSDYLLKAPVHQSMKQRARDAYAAGMSDPLVVAAPAAVAGPSVYVAAHECAECNHVGINDEHEVDAACYFCGWNGVSPDEDRCPSCKKDGAMTAACPKCSGAYRLLADANIAAAPTTQPAPVAQGDA